MLCLNPVRSNMAAHSLQRNIGHSHQDSDQIGTELQTSLEGVEDWLLLPSVWIPMAVLLGIIVWVLFRTLREAAQIRKLQDELQALLQRQLERDKEDQKLQEELQILCQRQLERDKEDQKLQDELQALRQRQLEEDKENRKLQDELQALRQRQLEGDKENQKLQDELQALQQRQLEGDKENQKLQDELQTLRQRLLEIDKKKFQELLQQAEHQRHLKLEWSQQKVAKQEEYFMVRAGVMSALGVLYLLGYSIMKQ